MRITFVVAMAENRAIGNNNQLPWHLPADLQHFKQITLGKPILMGRKTFQSIGRPLPGRTNIIITQDENFKAENCIIVHSIESALATAKDQPELCVIGGAELFRQMLPFTKQIYLTLIHHDFSADTFFPELNAMEWKEIARTDHFADEKNIYSYSFLTLERIS
ncbi:MAG TPA: dihydrofolate reductase [Gammaproteobacteria bacterium]|nr:dihydrofolate reductase [Gammaproteobacteria bacterium]